MSSKGAVRTEGKEDRVCPIAEKSMRGGGIQA